jgi:hypothetical protein
MTDKTVSHAIERGIDFLFANRLFCGNEPRLWEDFDLLLRFMAVRDGVNHLTTRKVGTISIIGLLSRREPLRNGFGK